jgi:hypothetical protein
VNDQADSAKKKLWMLCMDRTPVRWGEVYGVSITAKDGVVGVIDRSFLLFVCLSDF